MEQAFIDAQVLTTAVLLKDFDLIPGVMAVVREMNLFAKVSHVYRHSALVHRAPQHGGILGGKEAVFIVTDIYIFGTCKRQYMEELRTSLAAPKVDTRSRRPLLALLGGTFALSSFLFVGGGTGVTKALMTGRQ